ncbi:holo-ACP synthase AcpS [Gordonia humi]|uniref:Holo-[acyl-carrier-protein] synthase n=1 Tax=Gordonia humi TaxID=686429 RepID=A0A840F6L8_9ACTN|nr:holo-ACP synthase [Gordonia humi]MBB4135870.1 holo-[acyl-carrier protein] synthase [Gordonia humi]
MSVVGVGIDMVSVPEFSEQLSTPGSTFIGHFSVGERRDVADRTGDGARNLAARWAAREAVIKAWSSSRFGLPPLLPETAVNEVEIQTDAHGRPRVRLHGDLANAIGHLQIHVSLTHDGDMAAAVAVLEERPAD